MYSKYICYSIESRRKYQLMLVIYWWCYGHHMVTWFTDMTEKYPSVSVEITL